MNKKLFFFLTFFVTSQAIFAENIIKDSSTTINSKNTSDISYGPNRAQTMSSVVKAYGDPLKKDLAIGNPPITKWYYKDFTVIFESKYVTQSVLKQNK